MTKKGKRTVFNLKTIQTGGYEYIIFKYNWINYGKKKVVIYLIILSVNKLCMKHS